MRLTPKLILELLLKLLNHVLQAAALAAVAVATVADATQEGTMILGATLAILSVSRVGL